jgi:hypothetical protein
MVLAATFCSTAFAEGWHSAHGYSTGGSEFAAFPGGLYYGVHMRSGQYVDQISLRTITVAYPWTPAYGGSGGTDMGEHLCPNNGYMVGISGRADFYVDALAIICSDGYSTYTVGYTGGSGGNAFTDMCGPNEYVMGVKGRAGDWLDSIQIYCRRYGY